MYEVSTGSSSDQSEIEFTGNNPVATARGTDLITNKLNTILKSFGQRNYPQALLKLSQIHRSARAKLHFDFPSRN